MEPMTLREAAHLTSRSVTTLRRYIRSGRLAADKRRGRYGPEYVVTERHLADAGIQAVPREEPAEPASHPALRDTPEPPASAVAAAVPIVLYQELQMKHEQLLVQYGMVRAGGMRAMEQRAELEARRRDVAERDSRLARLRAQNAEEIARLKQLLRRTELEQEGRGLEVAALREKVRALEMLTRSSRGTKETIEEQLGEVMQQMRRVDRLSGQREDPPQSEKGGPWSSPRKETDH